MPLRRLKSRERESKLFGKKIDSKAVKFCDFKLQSFNQKLILNSSSKSQSAMEYLMTYGWAILIIAIAMVALFQLGVFNGTFFAPRATAGACEVYRSVEGVNLVGQCQGELPQFVTQFNGASSAISIPTSYTLTNFNGLTQVTLVGWINTPTIIGGAIADCGYNGLSLTSYFGSTLYPTLYINVNGILYGAVDPNQISPNTWYQLAATYDGSNIRLYVNGVLVKTTPVSGTISNTQTQCNSGNWKIGENSYGGYEAGYISNVQIYNASLSANEINALYLEGIGGAPIDPTHIVGWWPLNGNAQDYSGNNNGGTPTNIAYTSSWTSGYTQP